MKPLTMTALVLAFAAPALAAEPPPAGPPPAGPPPAGPPPAGPTPPGYDAPSSAVAEPAETKPRHGGFFLRAALGPGYFYAANKAFSTNGDRRVFRGGTSSLQLVAGGTLRGNFVILGGAYTRDDVFALSSKDSIIDGDEPDLDGYDMTQHSLGFFVDVYLGAHSGTHLQLLLGTAWLGVDNPSGNDRDTPMGRVMQLGVGHEFWVLDSLLVGGLFSLSHARLQTDETGFSGPSVTIRTLIPTLSITGTFN